MLALLILFCEYDFALKETPNSTKHPKKNKNYNEILEKPFIFNLQIVSTARRRCRSSLSQPDVVGCGQEVAEWVMKTTSVSETKKEKELVMKLLDDPKIPTARRNPQRPHHSHKPLDVAAEMGLKPRRPYCTRRRHHHLNATSTNLGPKNGERNPQSREWNPPTDEDRDPPRLYDSKVTETGRSAAAPAGSRLKIQSRLGSPVSGVTVSNKTIFFVNLKFGTLCLMFKTYIKCLKRLCTYLYPRQHAE
jgi:hypothetical protein